jgi:DNA polymerase-3 subunit epsilon
LKTLLDEARKKKVRIWALNSHYDYKDILKARGYSWSADQGLHRRTWYIDVEQGLYQAEMEFLTAEVFKRDVSLPTTRIDCFNRFSGRI